jgi:hypothetical protein
VLGVEVLPYGIGEGTWAAGKPGMIFHASLRLADGHTQSIVSDPSWQCLLDRAHRPGTPKQWFLRTLQEEFDRRLHPAGCQSELLLPKSAKPALDALVPDHPLGLKRFRLAPGQTRTFAAPRA